MSSSLSSQKVTELAEGILLYTTDHYAATGRQGGTISAIEFELEVRKNKLVIFEIDFTGSTNLALEHAQQQGLKRKTCVEPNVRMQVALIHIADPTKSWSLETKYTWLEENPGTVQPGQSKQEKLAEGLVLTTTRTNEMFVFYLQVEKQNAVRVTLDCSKSENLQMVLAGGEVQTDNVVSLALPANSRSLVCSLQVRNPNLGYKLKTKWSWSETGVVTAKQQQSENAFGDENFSITRRKQVDTSPPQQASFLSMTPTRERPATTALVPQQPNNKLQRAPSKVKREEISPQVFLITEIAEVAHRCEITYVLQVEKNTRVMFEANFTGSHNLQLTPGGGLVCEAFVEPFRKMQVARLESLDVNLPWKLQCKYKWQEEDLERPALLPSIVTPAPVAPQQQPTGVYDVRSLLASLSLDGYADLFVAEELTLDLLRVMVRDEAEFRRSLESLGVNKMGHRERIIVALKQLPVHGTEVALGE